MAKKQVKITKASALIFAELISQDEAVSGKKVYKNMLEEDFILELERRKFQILNIEHSYLDKTVSSTTFTASLMNINYLLKMRKNTIHRYEHYMIVGHTEELLYEKFWLEIDKLYVC